MAILRYTWKKAEKLKSRKRIDQVFKQGRHFSVFPFKVFYLLETGLSGADALSKTGEAADVSQANAGPGAAAAGNAAPIQAGFGAGSRNFKKAVDRNRIKRLCREAWRLQKNTLVEQLRVKDVSLSLFILYTGKELPDYQTVTAKFGVILQKLLKETA